MFHIYLPIILHIVLSNWPNDISGFLLTMKGRVYNATVLSTLLYECETRALRSEAEHIVSKYWTTDFFAP